MEYKIKFDNIEKLAESLELAHLALAEAGADGENVEYIKKYIDLVELIFAQNQAKMRKDLENYSPVFIAGVRYH